MKQNVDLSVLSMESKLLLKKFYGAVSDINSRSMSFGTPCFHEGYPCFEHKLGQVKGHVSGQKNLLKECKMVRTEIQSLISELKSICSYIEDTSCGIVNSFETPYDCDSFIKGSKYKSKFIDNSTHWSCADAKEEWKEDYEKCLKLFNEITSGLTTHNFRIFRMDDGSKAHFSFTVHGVPGDFEVSFPLNSKEYPVNEHWLDSSSLPMQMRLTWRRHWVIPYMDYFFDDFGTYEFSELNAKLREFVSTEKWREFYNTKSYKNDDGFEVEYDEKTNEYLEKILSDEIEACSKEGKKVR